MGLASRMPREIDALCLYVFVPLGYAVVFGTLLFPVVGYLLFCRS